MQISPKEGPTTISPAGATSSKRDAAIASLSKAMAANASAPQAPVNPLSAHAPQLNQNSISPEDSLALKSGRSDLSVETESEVPPTEVTKAATPEDPISTQYANLARKEKAIRAKALQQEQAYKAKEAAMLAREEAFKAKEAEYQSKYISKDKLSQDTLNALADAGLTYDQITELMLNSNSPERKQQSDYEKRLDAKLAELERKQADGVKAQQEQQTQAYQQAIKQIKSDTTSLVTSDPNFETIKETNSIDDVVELIERTFKQDGILLSVEDAAKQVEDYLVEEAFKLTKLKKIQQRLTPAKPAEVQQEPPKQPQTLKTLTNAVASSGKLSVRDRAIAAFKGQK